MIRAFGTAFAALLGLAFGSFLNVCVSRWPKGESIVKPRSYCDGCGRTLTWWENIPLLSWLALRGCCRACCAWIGWRYPLVEISVAAIWALIVWRSLQPPNFWLSASNPNPALSLEGSLLWMAFLWVLVFLAALDFEHYWIPDVVTIPMILLGFALPFLSLAQAHHMFMARSDNWGLLIDRALEILAAAGLILLIRWVYWLIRRREGVGLGDAKLMAMLAAWLGIEGALLSFGIGVVLGALVALLLLARRSKETQSQSWALQKLPLGTFLCIGGIVSGLWGERIIEAYLRWAGF
jgi:leader peptidase (prepilin peptidase) / N-methyltransferase